jgi:hypothetical protein
MGSYHDLISLPQFKREQSAMLKYNPSMKPAQILLCSETKKPVGNTSSKQKKKVAVVVTLTPKKGEIDRSNKKKGMWWRTLQPLRIFLYY